MLRNCDVRLVVGGLCSVTITVPVAIDRELGYLHHTIATFVADGDLILG